MDLHLSNKVIVITGGAAGIGEAIAVGLALEKAVVVLVDRNADAIKKLLQRIGKAGGTAYGIMADLTKPDDCVAAIQRTIEIFGRIDGLVNNAGDNDSVGLEMGNYERFMTSIHKNLVHYYLMAHHALPYLKTSKGVIVNIGSKVAETGQGNTSAYAAANGGRNALTREWAAELAPYGIRVNAVIVAESWTPLYQKKLAHLPNPTAIRKAISQRIPLGQRMTDPEEIANTVLFLLSNCASHTTGQLIHIDGGYVHLDRASQENPTHQFTNESALLKTIRRLFRK